MRAASHRDLDAWWIGMILALHVYEATRAFPKDEAYGLVAQLRRAAVSIPANVAEGAGRSGPREFAHFLSIARGGLAELETELLLSVDLGYMRYDDVAFALVDRLAKLLTGLRKRLCAR